LIVSAIEGASGGINNGRGKSSSSIVRTERLALREVLRLLFLRYQTNVPPSVTTMIPATTPPMIADSPNV